MVSSILTLAGRAVGGSHKARSNLRERKDLRQSLTENFDDYDALNRLKSGKSSVIWGSSLSS